MSTHAASAITTEDVAVGDHIFHLSTSGDGHGPPVLWLHGAEPGVSALDTWTPMLRDLAGDFHNLAPDLIGYADSTHPDPPPPGLGEFAQLRVETLVALLDHLGIDQVDLVGNSMGGIISLCLALAHPDRVRRIVLMGTGGAPVAITPELLSLILFFEDPTREAMQALVEACVHDPAAISQDLDALAEERMVRVRRVEVERSHRATFGPGAALPIDETSMASVTAPVLILHGDDDRLVPLDGARWYEQALPNARLEVIQDGGHELDLEHHERCAQEIKSFLTPA